MTARQRVVTVGCNAPTDGHKVWSSQQRRECPVHGDGGGGPLARPNIAIPKPVMAASVHRAGSGKFDPEDYSIAAYYDMSVEVKRFARETQDLQLAEDVPVGDRCSHCGKKLRYVALLRHTSGEYVTAGQTCLSDRFSITKDAFDDMRKRGKDRARAMVLECASLGPEDREAFIADNGCEWAREDADRIAAERDQMWRDSPSVLAAITYPEMFGDDEPVLRSFAESLMRQLGAERETLTPNQIDSFAHRWKSSLEIVARDQARREQREHAAPAPVGKNIVVEGTVAKISARSSDFGRGGTYYTMLVALPGGARVSVTRPRAISSARTGDKVRFAADFESAGEDRTFSRGKRPRDAEITYVAPGHGDDTLEDD